MAHRHGGKYQIEVAHLERPLNVQRARLGPRRGAIEGRRRRTQGADVLHRRLDLNGEPVGVKIAHCDDCHPLATVVRLEEVNDPIAPQVLHRARASVDLPSVGVVAEDAAVSLFLDRGERVLLVEANLLEDDPAFRLDVFFPELRGREYLGLKFQPEIEISGRDRQVAGGAVVSRVAIHFPADSLEASGGVGRPVAIVGTEEQMLNGMRRAVGVRGLVL